MRLAHPDRFLRLHLRQATHAGILLPLHRLSVPGNGYRFRLHVSGGRLVGRAGQARQKGRVCRRPAPVVSPPRHAGARRLQQTQTGPLQIKVEWKGDGFVGLNSKTYCWWGTESNKASCKGISKKLNNLQKEVYLNVLQTRQSQSGENRGFRVVDNKVLTYAQHRTGFSYFYPKRKVLQDSVSTVPLDVYPVEITADVSILNMTVTRDFIDASLLIFVFFFCILFIFHKWFLTCFSLSLVNFLYLSFISGS